MEEYKDHIFKSEEVKVEPLDWKDFKYACSNSESAGGLDVWTKKEFHMSSDEGFKLITKWMQQIEDLND